MMAVMDQEQGMAAANAAAGYTFQQHARASIVVLALTQKEITTDDVWKHLWDRGVDTEHRGAMGSIMRRAARDGIVVKTDRMVPAKRDDQRKHGLIVWQSCIYGGDD